MTYGLFAHNTAPAASIKGSILLCNDYRHASEVVDDVQLDINGLAIIRPHRSSPIRARQYTPKVSGALTSLDPRWGRSIRALAMSSFSNSSKPRYSCGRVVGQASQAMTSWLPAALRGVGGSWDALTDLRSERQLESEISPMEAAISTPLAGFTTHRHTGRLAVHAGDPQLCHRRSINQRSPIGVSCYVVLLSCLVETASHVTLRS